MRSLAFALSSFCVIAAVSAQNAPAIRGEMTLTFGQVRGPDGKMYSVKGLKVPYTLRLVDLKPMNSLQRVFWNPQHRYGGDDTRSLTSMTTIYQAQGAQNEWGTFNDEWSNPSALDDMVLTSSGQPWKHLTAGFQINQPAGYQFLVRWIVYDNFVGDTGHNNSAFTGVIADFGGIVTSQQPNVGHIFTYDLQGAGFSLVCPDTSIYMAQQHRLPQLDGNGAFDHSVLNVYNYVNPPTVGSSNGDVFFFDWDDENGIYSADEQDDFESPYLANMLRTVTVEGSASTNQPIAATVNQGTYVSGQFFDLWSANDVHFIGRPTYNVSRSTAPLQMTVEGISEFTTLTTMRLAVEAGTSGGGRLRVQMLHRNGSYVTLTERQLTGSADVAFDVIVPTPSQYVRLSDGRMFARFHFFPPANVNRSWAGRIDRAVWFTTH